MAKKKPNNNDPLANIDDINVFINKLFNEMMEQNEDQQGGAYRFDIRVDQNGVTISPSQAAIAPVQIQKPKAVEREPLVDVVERKGEIVVLAELGGTEKKDIEVHSDSERLSLKAVNGNNVYSKLVPLPEKVDPSTAVATYNNGVLEVSLKKSNAYKGLIKIGIR